MKLESSLKHFSPQGMLISDSVKGTSPDRITGTDVMVAIGTTSSRARFGLAAFFGKTGISKSDEQLAVQALARHAMDTAPKNVRKAAGGEFGWCMLVLAQFAFAEYSRSAATSVTCHTCKGSGRITRTQTTRKVSYPWGKAPYWASRSRAVRPSDWEKWTVVKVRCSTALRQKKEVCRCLKPVNVVVARGIQGCLLRPFTGLSLNVCLISINPHGHVTGSHFMKCWWMYCTRESVRHHQNLREQPVVNTIGTDGDKFSHDSVDFA